MPKHAKESVDRFFDYDIYVEARTLYFGSVESDLNGEESGVDAALANRIIKGLRFLQNLSHEPITIIMNTYGGSWYHGLGIYDAIRASPCIVRIEVLGAAMSMGAVILQAADERILHPNSTIMIHDGTEDEMPSSMTPKTFQAWAEESKRNLRRSYQILASRSHNKDLKYWELRCCSDYILTAEQAVAEGLADYVAYPKPKAAKVRCIPTGKSCRSG
jgi:ATP-dependent Clp protease protease subunit